MEVEEDLFFDSQMPLVVCRLSASDMTLKSVLKSAFNRVDFPVDWDPNTDIVW